MEISKRIEKNKSKILSELYIWAETFNPENMLYDKNRMEEEDEKELHNSYYYVLNLIEKLANNRCSEKDYEDIFFHVEQINYDKERILL